MKHRKMLSFVGNAVSCFSCST